MLFRGVMEFLKPSPCLFRVCRAVVQQEGKSQEIRSLLINYLKWASRRKMPWPWRIGRTYWGDQPGTAGPVYLGAVICFLFILGMVYVKSWHKWWIFVRLRCRYCTGVGKTPGFRELFFV